MWSRMVEKPRSCGSWRRFFNLVNLVNQLEQEKAAGRSGRLCREAAAL